MKSPNPVNVQGTRNVLEIARELAMPHIVYTSTVGVFGDTRGRMVDETYYARGPFLDGVRPEQVDSALRSRNPDDRAPVCHSPS